MRNENDSPRPSQTQTTIIHRVSFAMVPRMRSTAAPASILYSKSISMP